MHDQRESKAKHELDGHRDDRDDQRDEKSRPPILVGENGLVVGQPDKLVVSGAGQVVALQAQPDRIPDRVGGHREHQDNRGRDQQVRETPLGTAIVGADGRCGHGISPLPSMAFCTWTASSSAVFSGSIAVIGASVAEMRVDIA